MKDRVLFTIDKEVNKKFKELAKKNSISKSALVNNLILQWINKTNEDVKK